MPRRLLQRLVRLPRLQLQASTANPQVSAHLPSARLQPHQL